MVHPRPKRAQTSWRNYVTRIVSFSCLNFQFTKNNRDLTVGSFSLMGILFSNCRRKN